MMMKITAILVAAMLLLGSCTNPNNTENKASTPNTVSDINEIIGAWKFKDIDFDFQVKIDLPGVESLIKDKISSKLKEEANHFQIIYHPDHTFEVKNSDQQTKGTYSLDNKELIHTNFSNNSSIMNYTEAHMSGDSLILSINSDQFWKMMKSINNPGSDVEKLQQVLTVHKITYTLIKI